MASHDPSTISGTGYTSIGQLGRFPLDTLKIDRSSIAMLSTSDKLVHTMAQGVEDHGQLAALRLLNCDAAQGSLFAEPQPPSRSRRAAAARSPGETARILAATGDTSPAGI